MNSIKIKKAKIKSDLFLSVEFTESLEGHKSKETKLTCDVPIHQDMKDAFAMLNKHLALLCDEISYKGKDLSNFNEENAAKFKVQGFTLVDSGEYDGIMLSGSKEGKYGSINLNTPIQNYGNSAYEYMDDLSISSDACVYEVEQYLFNGKRAPDVQGELEFNQDDDFTAEVTVSAGKTKKSQKPTEE